jgi:hypothetical protein
LIERLLNSFEALKEQEEELIVLISKMLLEMKGGSLSITFDSSLEAIGYTLNRSDKPPNQP